MNKPTKTKEFGQYRVKLIREPWALGPQILITDKKACDRIVVKIEAQNGHTCFDSITQNSIEKLLNILGAEKHGFDRLKKEFALLVTDYIYGTIDMVNSIEWFNRFAADESKA